MQLLADEHDTLVRTGCPGTAGGAAVCSDQLVPFQRSISIGPSVWSPTAVHWRAVVHETE
jgi:hypothetical protein